MVTPLSSAEIDGDGPVEDLGEIFIPDEDEPPPLDDGGRRSPPVATTPPAPPDGEGPGHTRKGWAKPPGRPRGPAKPGRITNTIRADINAKISMPLEIMGQIWAARDPLCGGRFLEQRAPIADCFTDIVCDSADLVAFFTGPGGAFMKYLNLGAAVWPVAEMVAAHHVYHTVALEEPGQQPNPSTYAA